MSDWHYLTPPEVVEKGGKGSGWFAPPKGTHIGRYSRRGKGKAAPSFAAMAKLQMRENKLSDRLSKLRVGLRSLKPKYRKKRAAEMMRIRQQLKELARRKKKLTAAQRTEWRKRKAQPKTEKEWMAKWGKDPMATKNWKAALEAARASPTLLYLFPKKVLQRAAAEISLKGEPKTLRALNRARLGEVEYGKLSPLYRRK